MFNIEGLRISPCLNTPFATLLAGVVTYQPSLTRQASYRLPARYNAPAQFLGEEGIQGELVYSFNRKTNIQLNYSTISKYNADSG